jgi:TonB family protein
MRPRLVFRLAYTVIATAFLLMTGCFGGGNKRTTSAINDSRYTHALHSRFYAAWEQPDSLAAPRGKISVPADVEIDRSGRVLRFKIAQPSGYPALDASIRAAGKRVPQVDPPPIPSETNRLKLRVNFDLDVKR